MTTHITTSAVPRILSAWLLAALGPSLLGCEANQGTVSPDISVATAKQAVTSLTLLPLGSDWRYLDNGTDPGEGWNQPSWDDSAWNSGRGELGYGDGDEATTIGYGPNPWDRYATTYFRAAFELTKASEFDGIRMSLVRDDAAIVYLNGIEIFRNNLPASGVTYQTRALRDIGAPEESIPIQIDVPATLAPNLLVEGRNVIAVELHQGYAWSTDLSFDLELQAIPGAVVRGPYLQDGTPHSAVVAWRTSGPTTSRVRFGTRPNLLAHEVIDATPTTDHAVTVTGLEANKTYYYAVGTDKVLLVGGDEEHYLKTLPEPGQALPTRVWVVGDPSTGWGGADPKAVRDAYVNTLGARRRTDVILFPGDQAYFAGDDYAYTRQIFDIYSDFMRSTFSWNSIGNHDANFATADAEVALAPYFKIYSLPTAGEAGGIASGTERYYSFDYGDIHFVALDAQTMTTSGYPTGMLDWLETDLAATTQQWLIAFLHKSPYSRGQHNSDVDADMTAVRTQIVPILERHGVDLVLAGHSHVYERSYFINGHYGQASEFGDGSAYLVQPGDGRISGNGPYLKPERGAGPTANRGTVYVVTGSAGATSGGTLNHPAMVTSMNVLGSLVIDVDRSRMDVRFLRETGAIDDEFTLLHGAQANTPPSVTLSLDGGGTVPPVNATVTAEAADADDVVTTVAFYLNGEPVGTDHTAPFQADISAAVPGTYQVLAVATDNLGSATMSRPLSFQVNPPPPVLSGSEAPGSAFLSWNRSSTLERKYRIDRAIDGGNLEHIGTVWADRFTSYMDPSLEPNHAYSYRVRAILSSGTELSSNQITLTPPRGAPDVIVSAGALWKYLDDGSNQGTDWQSVVFDDNAWKTGVSQLGYGDRGMGVDYEEETVIGYGPSATSKYITAYFRKNFYVSDAAAYAAEGVKLGQRVLRDDGAVVYLNGAEIGRVNMPSGAIDYMTRASTAAEDAWVATNNITSNLVDGWNVIAAEMHQSDPASSDLSFDLELRKTTPEICDGYDNDVDGSIDEGFAKGPGCTVGSGECLQTGVGVCSSDGALQCTNLSTRFPLDRTSPVIQSVTPSPRVLRQRNHKFAPVHVNVRATDNCGAAPSCYILSIASDEPCEERGPRKLCPQWQVTGALDLLLQAERNCGGDRDGRVYTINVVCRDARGNSARASTTVTVPH